MRHLSEPVQLQVDSLFAQKEQFRVMEYTFTVTQLKVSRPVFEPTRSLHHYLRQGSILCLALGSGRKKLNYRNKELMAHFLNHV